MTVEHGIERIRIREKTLILFYQLPDDREQVFRNPLKAQIGQMDSIHSTFPIASDQPVGLDIIQVTVSPLFHFFENLLQKTVFLLNLLFDRQVEKDVRKKYVVDEQNGCVRSPGTENFKKPYIFFVHLRHSDIGKAVDHKTRSIDTGHSLGNFIIQLAVTAESQIDGLPVKHPG